MTDQERALMQQLYDQQGLNLEALQRASESLQRSHEVIEEMLKAADVLRREARTPGEPV